MSSEERISAYLHSLETDEGGLLAEIEKQAIKTDVPIIRKETQSFIKVLLQIKKPKNILEIGTAVGFSALFMNKYANEASITTIENYEKRIPIARENFRLADKEKDIRLIEGDALEILPTLSDNYDFIFVDAAKAQYINYLDELIRMSDNGGLILTDNVLQDGDILESHYAVKRRDRTIHRRMREYLYEIKHNNNLTTTIVPVGDGVALSVVRGEDNE